MNDKSAISIYRPKPVLLPKSIKQHPQVQAILLEYLEEVVYGNNSNAPIRLAWDLNDDPQVRAGLGGNGRNVGDGNNGSSDDNDASSDAMNNNSKPYNQFNHPPSSLYKSMSQDDKLGL
ncbi:MAG: hypothetical protein HAW61_03505, partial [Candidatus Portiera sp.]|nr:hypothetical protein [Portiera sp.]